MKSFFIYTDGRLKTSRIAVIVFCLMLLAVSLVFKFRKPVDQVLVNVKHVFEAEQPKNRTVPENNRSKDTALTPSQPEKSTPEITKPEAPIDEFADSKPESNPASSNEKEPEKQQAQKRASAERIPDNQTEPEAAGRNSSKRPDHQKESTPAVLVQAHKENKTKNAAEGNPLKTKAQIPKKLDEDIFFSDLKKLKENSAEPENERFQKTATAEIKNLVVDRHDRVKKEKGKEASPIDGPLQMEKYRSTEEIKESLRVDSEQYETLFHQWRKSGSVNSKTERPPLRVQNLEKVYDLFQMKPVAIVNKTHYIDLRDGSRLLAKALNAYSDTVFRVDRPWQKWAEALDAARIRRSDDVEVRYYMYGFIENAIFQRASRALVWCRKKGIIGEHDPANRVDILGKAFCIQKKAGGRFGVFVPVSVNTLAGRSVAIDLAECFPSEPDIHALRSAGMI